MTTLEPLLLAKPKTIAEHAYNHMVENDHPWVMCGDSYLLHEINQRAGRLARGWRTERNVLAALERSPLFVKVISHAYQRPAHRPLRLHHRAAAPGSSSPAATPLRHRLLRGGPPQNRRGCARVSRHDDITGDRFGRLIAVERVGSNSQGASRWHCRCDCGNDTMAQINSLRYGTTQSCGCLQRDRTRERATTHGLSGGRTGTPRLYGIWRNMKQRCQNPRATKYHLYGARGVRVCSQWKAYEAFHEWALANGYADHLTIDRINGQGHYEPGNCRWVSRRQQTLNTTQNRLLTYQGKTLPLSEWADRLGIKATTLSARINTYGWPTERALSVPVRKRRAA